MASELDRLCRTLGIKAEAQYGGVELPEDWGDPAANPWKVTLKFGRRRLTVPFFTGSACTGDPTPADVLSCLCSDARAGDQSFEDFCGDFGYDVDSRKAERTYRACAKMGPRVRRFLGDLFEDIANAEH